MPGISKIGTHNQGFDVFSISLESDILQAEILNFGATLKDLRFNGFENSIVLGYTSLQDYFSDKNYLGVIIGRYANRISNGQYFFESKEFELDKNEFSTTLHGGSQSCHNAPWKIENYDYDFVELSYQFNDGDMGFGGSLSVKVRYELDGAKLTFKENALKEIAQKAIKKKTGARGLRSILENILLKTMYDLPSQENIDEVIIDSSAAKGQSQPILVHSKSDSKSKSNKTTAA